MLTKMHVAIHEAAHYVITNELQTSDGMGHVSIRQDDCSFGRHRHSELSVPDGEEFPIEWSEAQMHWLLAGYVAETRFDPSTEHAQCAKDGAGSDFENADEIAASLGKTREDFIPETRRLVDRLWPRIEAAAWALEVVEEISAMDLEEWIEFTFDGVPGIAISDRTPPFDKLYSAWVKRQDEEAS